MKSSFISLNFSINFGKLIAAPEYIQAIEFAEQLVFEMDIVTND